MTAENAGSGILSVNRSTLERLAQLLLDRAGLKISSEGFHSLRLALSARLPAVGSSDPLEYVQWLHEPSGEGELRSLIPLVTVGYTEFFRDPRQFRALEVRILPEMLAAARKTRRTALIWSAGCATGEEPYSLAVALDELGARPSEVEILATDLNQAAVESASVGMYPARRLSGMGPSRLTKYFQPAAAGGFEVQPLLRPFIRFESHNLAAPLGARVAASSLDLILCRNVIIYFDLPTIRSLMERFLASLRPGGYLLLGYSESLFKVYDKFEMVEVEGAFVYRRPLEGAAPKPKPDAYKPLVAPGEIRRFTPTAVPMVVIPQKAPAPRAPERTPLPPPPAATLKHSPTQAGSSVSLGRSPQQRLDAAVHRMDQGDFEGAREALERLTEAEPNDLDALLTLGNLYSLFGEHDHAKGAFELALRREPLCVDARVFLAVAALQAGKLDEASSELKRVLFLEPTLALGHYLQAQVHERSKNRHDARRAYKNAIAQLKFNQRPLAGHYPDAPDSREAIHRAARYALAALEEEV